MEPACSLPSSQQPDILNYMNPFLNYPPYSFMLIFNTLHRLLVLAVGHFLATPFICLCSTCVQVAPDCCNLFRTIVYPKNYSVRIPIRPPLSVRNGKHFFLLFAMLRAQVLICAAGCALSLRKEPLAFSHFTFSSPQSEVQHLPQESDDSEICIAKPTV